MGESSGIGGGGSLPIKPNEPEKLGDVTGQPSGGSIENALHTPVKNLNQLKQVLIENLGKKEGTKMYNGFVKSFAMQMLSQMQQSAAQAKKAAQQMRQGPQG